MRRVNPPANPNAAHLGSATVLDNFLYIHNIERALFHGVPFSIVDFSGGKAGFVRIELKAGIV